MVLRSFGTALLKTLLQFALAPAPLPSEPQPAAPAVEPPSPPQPPLPPEPQPVAESQRAAPAVPSYFTEPSWSLRRIAVIAALPPSMGAEFAAENARRIGEQARAKGRRTRMHVVFNLGADALLNYLRSGKYLNAYQNPVVNGVARAPSAVRIAVDKLLGAGPPDNLYFCALAMGGSGIRFYGAYCAVLKSPDDARGVRRVLDRNSYDLIAAPIKQFLAGLGGPGQRRFIDGLCATFRSADCADMVAIKVLQTTNAHARLITAATIGAALIDDEDYVEAYHEGRIGLASVLEIRERGEETATEASINGRVLQRQPVAAAELLWIARREAVRAEATAANIAIRSVSASGRTQRWR